MGFECKICGVDDKASINFLGKKICKECISKITNTETDTVLDYEYYKANIKEMWLDYITN
ncbi:MAG: sigma factor G inhibitor Gin [Senegalia sp. (in: firmicutes)]|uniref:sigma factor G inhibitor Gin n=1 Tax=Senegalia sp. (in: firmicutes) TaxID=1924098 RepID=UPI003F983EC1